MEKVKVMQIGAGGFGKSWLDVVGTYEDAELVAVADVMKDNLMQAKDITGLENDALFVDPNEMLNKVQADIVLVVTPPKTHKEIAIKALTSGFHVLMEKPLTHTYEEAVELLEFSRHCEKHLMISQNYRWRAPIQTVKKLLQQDLIGKIGYVEYEFRKAMKFGGWRDQYNEILLEDMSIHHFDIMRFLLEKEPVEVYAQSYRPDWSWFSGNPTAGVLIKFEDQIRVNYFGSWVSRGKETTWNGDIRIVGERGAIELINDEIKITQVDDENQSEHYTVDLVQMKHGDRASSLDDLVQAIHETHKPSTCIDDNIRSFELTCMAIQSAKTGEKIKTADFSKIQYSEV